jgi:hypothetical protein
MLPIRKVPPASIRLLLDTHTSSVSAFMIIEPLYRCSIGYQEGRLLATRREAPFLPYMGLHAALFDKSD